MKVSMLNRFEYSELNSQLTKLTGNCVETSYSYNQVMGCLSTHANDHSGLQIGT